MWGSDTLAAAREVAAIFESLGVRYLVGGSLASSLYGIPRSTQDADLVADLRFENVAPFVSQVENRFYVSPERVRDAVRRRASFNLIHLATMTKVDVFVLRATAMHQEEMSRRVQLQVPDHPGSSLWVATAEDVILQKLAWFVAGGQVSERQWLDVQGVLKVQGDRLDLARLRAWAGAEGLGELLERAVAEANGG